MDGVTVHIEESFELPDGAKQHLAEDTVIEIKPGKYIRFRLQPVLLESPDQDVWDGKPLTINQTNKLGIEWYDMHIDELVWAKTDTL